MNLKTQAIVKYVLISIAFHLAVGAVIVSIKPERLDSAVSFESVIQVDLVAPPEEASVRPSRPLPSRPISDGAAAPPPPGPAVSTGAALPLEIPARLDTVPAETAAVQGDRPLMMEAMEEEKEARSSAPEWMAVNSFGPSAPIAMEAGPEPPANRAEEVSLFLQSIRTRLERAKRYPWGARMRGQEGTVHLAFRIDSQGEPQEVHLVESSRWPILDEEAVATVKRIGKFSNIPVIWKGGVRIQVPLVFRLE